METDWLMWLIALIFFLPMHFGVPLLYLLIQQGPKKMKEQLPQLLLWGGISTAVGFTAAVLLWPHSKTWAGVTIVIVLIHPWLELLCRHRHD